MKVSTRSWHYRWWRFAHQGYEQPRDLCSYFWGVVGPGLGLLWIAGIVIGGTGWLIYQLVIWVNGRWWLAAAWLAGGLSIAGLFWGARKLMRWYDRRHLLRMLDPPPPREPGLLISWLKAKKRRLCPLIEVVDEQRLTKDELRVF